MSANKIEVNCQAALERFMAITQIAGKSGQESAVAAQIVNRLKQAGVDESWIHFDDAHTRTPIAGDCGNLIVRLPGSSSSPPSTASRSSGQPAHGPCTLLSAHLDTVPICVGSQPVLDGDEIRSSAPTGLGADNRSGCAAIMTAIIERLKIGESRFPPAVIAFLVQEEVGLQGARNLDKAAIGTVDRAFNFDGGSVEKLVIGAIGGERMSIKLSGIPAHAGVHPEMGVSAVVIAARAIADLDARGWLGKVDQNGGSGTSNIGVISGGEATNVVTPEVTLRAEARSHDPAMRTRIVEEIRQAMQQAAAAVTNQDGQCGHVEFTSHVDYESFRLPEEHPSIAAAFDAIRMVGRQPYWHVSNGGLDANWLFCHGIEAVTLGCGQQNIHTADERLMIPDFLDACRIATWLITDGAIE